MSLVDDVGAYLTAQGLVGGATGWTLLRRRHTDDAPNQLVVISEDGGSAPEVPATAGIGDSAMAEPAVLCTVRGNALDGDTSMAKATAILTALHGLRNIQLGTGGAPTYLCVRAQTPEPIFAGYDDQQRPRHTVSFMALRPVAG